MKNRERLIYGLLITIVIFAISNLVGSIVNLGIDFLPSSFTTHSIMLILSVIAIFLLKRDLSYNISLPRFRKVGKPFLFGALTTIVVNILVSLVTKLLGGDIEKHALLTNMSPLQVFVFLFILASVAEELLFRGVLMNLLKPLDEKGITLFKRRLSLPVIISAVTFGLAHLILIKTGAGFPFLIRIVIFTTILGLVAGYYQEKYNNNAFAILVHMGGNSIALIGAFVLNH